MAEDFLTATFNRNVLRLDAVLKRPALSNKQKVMGGTPIASSWKAHLNDDECHVVDRLNVDRSGLIRFRRLTDQPWGESRSGPASNANWRQKRTCRHL